MVLGTGFFSGCVNVPEELTQFSIVSFDVEPGIINQGEYANLSWVVISASSVNIDNGIGNVALTGHRIIQPMQTTTYILTASNATTTKSATATITVKPAQQNSGCRNNRRNERCKLRRLFYMRNHDSYLLIQRLMLIILI